MAASSGSSGEAPSSGRRSADPGSAGEAPSSGRRSAGVPPEEAPPSSPAPPAANSSPTPAASQEEEQAAQAVADDLDRLLDETKRERDEYLELARRTKADFENFRKRVASEAAEAEKRGRGGLAGELVSVLDNLERALGAAGIEPGAALGGEGEAGGPLEQGVLLTYRELHGTLSRAGVEPIDPAGERFDPEWHEALQTRAADGAEAGTVVEVLQRGYRLDGRLIRPARVVVSE